MRRIVPFATLLLLAAAAVSCVTAAEIKVLAPLDRTTVRGVIEFRLKPEHGPSDQFFSNPVVIVRDERGRQVTQLNAVLDPKKGEASALWDAAKARDGLYQAEISYKYLVRGDQPARAQEHIEFGVRNTAARPAKILVQMEKQQVAVDEIADFEARVVDRANKPIPGLRVAFAAEGAELDTAAEITDSDGEVFGSVEKEVAGPVSLILSVPGLMPVRVPIQFMPAAPGA